MFFTWRTYLTYFNNTIDFLIAREPTNNTAAAPGKIIIFALPLPLFYND